MTAHRTSFPPIAVLLAGVLLAGAPAPNAAAAPAAPAAPKAAARQVSKITFLVRHRVFHDFAEKIETAPGKDFQVGDTDYRVHVAEYVPDFALNIDTGKVISRSDQPNNPAFHLIVRQKGVPQDTTWALLDMPPHFARKSLLAFQLLRIDFTSGPPLLPRATEPAKAAPSPMPPGRSGKK